MEKLLAESPAEMFALGERLGSELRTGDVVLLRGGLGAGKTLLTKGIAHSLGYDVDEVTSPSFALVNLYKTRLNNIYHIDLWRVHEGSDVAFDVGLHEIFEDPSAIIMIEWAERLGDTQVPGRRVEVEIEGVGDEPRRVQIHRDERNTANTL